MDPKRHYKKGDSKSLPKYFQVGTVVESASEFFTGRLTKKERKATLADELLVDHSLGDYRKRKVREIEEQRQPGGVDKWKIKGRQSLKRAKQKKTLMVGCSTAHHGHVVYWSFSAERFIKSRLSAISLYQNTRSPLTVVIHY